MIRYLILAAFVLLGLIVKGQAPVANFSSSSVQGCSPLTVTFNDLSTGTPRSWNWDLGNGQLSSLQNPTVIYTNPGKYTVTLVVRNANGTNGITKTDFITVNRSPTADFASDLPTACFGATIQFFDRSVANEGTITKWEWDFGDGTSSPLQNPTKKYNANGFYGVTLKVTSSTGCEKTIVKGRYIRILSGAKAAFTDSVNRVCQAPFNTNFKNETSGPGTLSYLWNFGNGATSTLKDPVASYPAAGNYNVQLIARSDLGCSDTSIRSIRISSANTIISSPDSACINTPINFNNTSTPAPLSSLWNFGDGTSSTQLNPSKTYAASGVYQVKLINRYASCSDSLTKNVTVIGSPLVDFTSASQGTCKAPFSANFQDVSPNAISWIWNFGDGGSSTQKNPVYNYTRAGEYDVSLTITTSFGCRNTIIKPKFIRIVPPVVSIAPSAGCIPFNYSPVANISSVDPVSAYLWEFGEGGATSTQSNPSYIYRNAGNYTVKLTITTAGGCTASVTVPNAVRTGTLPTADFSTIEDSSCISQRILFNDLSNPASEWLWNFGDGTTSILKNPSHSFTDTGRFTIALTAINNGCSQTVTKPQYITVLPPIAKFSYKVDCANKFSVSFINESIVDAAKGPVSYEWNFGDPLVGNSNFKDPTVNYPAIKTYTVMLTVTNGDCKDTITKQVVLTAELADFTTSKATVCKYERFNISAINSNPANIAQYAWSINGNTPFIAPRSFDTSFTNSSSYNIDLTITDNNGCTDRKSKSIVDVTGPTAGFTISNTSGCRNTVVDFNDQSSPVGNISRWTFNFGDGTTQSFTSRPFTHLYKDTGNFNVSLTVQDRTGCRDSLTIINAIKILRPVAAFRAEKTTFCPGAPLQFYDSSKSFGTPTYLWNFGDGTTSTLQNPTHAYTGKDSSYTVRLVVQDLLGCSDTLVKANYIQIKSSRSAFEVQNGSSLCPPLETRFFFKGQNYESFYWDFGDGTTSTLQDPTHFYNTYGTFTAKLFTAGVGGCFDSSEHVINVYNPSSIPFSYNPLVSCNSLSVDFNLAAPPYTTFIYYFGDAVQDSSQKTNVSHLYNIPSTYTPFVIMTDSLGCLAGVTGLEPIKIIGAEPLFSADKRTFCDSGTVYFTNFTIANDTITSSIWNFGDGITSTDKDPIYTYNKPGQYLASLTVNTKNGCSKTITDTIRVYSTPVPFITSDSIVCINSPIVFESTLAQADTSVKYNWSFGNGQTSNLQKPSVTFTNEGNYTVQLEAANPLGCKNSDIQNIRVVPLPVITIKGEPIIPVGSGVTIPVTYSQNVTTYNWTPPAGLSCTDCPNPVANPKINTTYTVNATDSNGCVASIDIIATVVCNDKNYFVPNTFTPNGDGNNDIFYPRGSSIARVQSMRIFNRWGEMVFEKRNFAANSGADGWNGSYKGKAALADVYVYMVEFICENGAIIPFKGNVTLLR